MNRLITILFFIFATCAPVHAQDNQLMRLPLEVPCGPEKPLLELLAQQKELLLFVGIGRVVGLNGSAYRGTMMTFTNQNTGRYTLVLRYPNGTMCMMLSGTHFQPYDGMIPIFDKDL